MKHNPLRPCLLALALPIASAAQTSPAVVGQELQALRGNGVSSVQWTRRAGYYTLQVVYTEPFSRSAALAEIFADFPPLASPQLPRIQVWVLQAQGRHVEPLNRHQVTGRLQASVLTRGQQRGGPRAELVYRYSLTDGADAEAVAVQVGNDFRIEKLLPLEGNEL